MPLLLIGSGLVLVLTGIKGNANSLYKLVASDFTGPNSFIYWVVSILILGALGYIKGLENLSKLFMILVVIVLLLDNGGTMQPGGQPSTNGGFFSQFQAFIKSTQTPAASTTAAPSSSASAPATTAGTQQGG
jgi:hypothetical protein